MLPVSSPSKTARGISRCRLPNPLEVSPIVLGCWEPDNFTLRSMLSISKIPKAAVVPYILCILHNFPCFFSIQSAKRVILVGNAAIKT